LIFISNEGEDSILRQFRGKWEDVLPQLYSDIVGIYTILNSSFLGDSFREKVQKISKNIPDEGLKNIFMKLAEQISSLNLLAKKYKLEEGKIQTVKKLFNLEKTKKLIHGGKDLVKKLQGMEENLEEFLYYLLGQEILLTYFPKAQEEMYKEIKQMFSSYTVEDSNSGIYLLLSDGNYKKVVNFKGEIQKIRDPEDEEFSDLSEEDSPKSNFLDLSSEESYEYLPKPTKESYDLEESSEESDVYSPRPMSRRSFQDDDSEEFPVRRSSSPPLFSSSIRSR
jgi:hypothetical protein